MTVHDLIVVGAGPSGSSTSIFASRLGMDVLILEKERKGRDKFCGGGIAYGAERFMVEKIGKEVSDTIELRIGGVVVFSPSGRELILKFSEELRKFGGLVRRSVFDSKLMEIAESEGAKLIEGKEVVGVRIDGDKVVAKARQGEEFTARYLVVATGSGDQLGEQLGIQPLGSKGTGGCWGTEVKFDVRSLMEGWKERWGIVPIFLFFGPVPSGYAWIFPKKEHLNLGIGTNLKNFKEHEKRFSSFLRKAKEMGVIPTDDIKHDRAATIPFGEVPRSKTFSSEGRAVLVGDAAGFVHPVTGEGIYGAIHGSFIAAEVLKKALDEEDPSLLKEYEERWWKEFGKDMFGYGKRIAKMLYGSSFMMEMGVKVVMCDEEASRRLGLLLAHYDEEVSRKMYERISGLSLMGLAIKSIRAPKRAEHLVSP